MASRKSNNAFYRSADLKRPFDNIKEAMGLTGNADSNYYTNLGKISRYEGSELDNTGKRGTLDALGQVLATMMGPGKEKQRYQEHLGLGGKAGDYARSRTIDELRGDLVTKGGFESDEAGFKADEAGSSAAVAELIRSLAGQIEKHGKPDIADYDTSNPNEMRPYGDAIKGSAGDFEELVRKIRALSLRGDAHKTGEQQSGLVESTIDTKKAQTSWYEERKKYVGLLGDKNVALVEERINSLKGLTDIRKKKIINDILNEVAELDQKILTEKGKRLTEGERTKLVQERLLVAQQNLRKAGAEADTAELEAGAKGGELYLNKRQLEVKLETLKEKRKKAKSGAEIAQLNQEYAKTLKLYEVEIKKQNKLKATSQADTAGITTETAGIQKDTATAKKDRAVNLASMSKQELDALGPKIMAQAEELQVRIRKGEQQIELAKARTGDVNMARNVKILKKANWNNKNRLQQLLSPYIQQEAKADASNAAGKFAHDTSKIMLKDQLKRDAKTSDDTVTIDPDSPWSDWTTWFNGMKVNKKEYAKINGAMFKHKDRIQSGSFPEKAKNAMIADIITSLQVEPSEAKKIYAYTIKSFGK